MDSKDFAKLIRQSIAFWAVFLGTMGNGTAAAINHDYANRIELVGCPVTGEAENHGPSQSEPGDPTSGDQSLWWSWIAPASGTYTITATTDNFTPNLYVFTGSDLSGLTLVGSDEGDWRGRWTLGVVIQAVEGTNYSVAVSRTGGSTGRVVVSIAAGLAPTVVLSAPTNGVTIYATERTTLLASPTDSAGEIAEVEFFGRGEVSGSIGVVTNFPFAMDVTFEYRFRDGGPQSQLLWAKAVSVAGIVSQSPIIQFWITYPPPVNDNFRERLPISGSFFTVQGNSLYASRELGDPTEGRASVWWEWTAPTSGVYWVTAVSPDHDFRPFVGLYSGSSLDEITTLTTNSSVYDVRATVEAIAGSPSVIGVSSVGGTTGGDIRLCISPADSPPRAAAFSAITGQLIQFYGVTNVTTLHLWFRTGTPHRWVVQASTNFLTWDTISPEFPDNVDLDWTTDNVYWRHGGIGEAIPYTVSPLYFRLSATF